MSPDEENTKEKHVEHSVVLYILHKKNSGQCQS